MTVKQRTQEFTYALDNLDTVANRIIQLLPACDIVTFTGPVGAGKTTLVQSILCQLGVTGPIVSPTFMYLQSYQVGGTQYNHFDLYRISDLRDFISSGFDEYLYAPDSVAFVEWPHSMEPLLKKRVCAVTLDYEGQDRRRARIELK